MDKGVEDIIASNDHEYFSKLYDIKRNSFFVIDIGRLKRKIAFIKSLFPYKTHYAVKANSSSHILKTIYDEGFNFEIASRGELDKLLAVGIDPANVIYSNPVKKLDDLVYTYEKGIHYFAFDSINELDKLINYAPLSEGMLRIFVSDLSREEVALNVELFGANLNESKELDSYADLNKYRISGMTFYVGSGCTAASVWEKALSRAVAYIDNLKADIEFINIGGGFDSIYHFESDVEYNEFLSELRDILAEFKEKNEIGLWIEPGAIVVCDCVYLVTRIMSTKEMDKREIVFLETGSNSGATCIDGDIVDFVTHKDSSKEERQVCFCGPTCDSKVYFKKMMTRDIAINDFVIIKNVGDYSLSLGNEFNGFSKPDIIVRD